MKPRRPPSSSSFEPAGWFAPTDDRVDPHVTPGVPDAARAHARRTCYVIGAGAIVRDPRGGAVLQSQTYGSFNALCESERFWQQPTVLERRAETWEAFGFSAYLVAPDLLLTCWHGWEQAAAEPQYAVFDYALRGDEREPTSLPPSRVYAISPYPAASARMRGREPLCDGDWAVLKLTQRVTHLGALSRTNVATATAGRGVYALGYPRGLPVKLAANARVLAVGAGEFRADLDTYVGNSGSPVFDAGTHALVGIVVEAQKDDGDFVPSPERGCYVSNRIEAPAPGQRAIDAKCFTPTLARVAGRSIRADR